MDKTNHQLIKGIAAKFAFSQNGQIFYWGSYETNAKTGLIKSIYPILIENQSANKIKLLPHKYIEKYVPYLINDNEIGFFDIDEPNQSLQPINISDFEGVKVEKIDCSFYSTAVILSNQKVFFGKRTSKVFNPKIKITNKPIDVAVCDMNFGSNYAILCEGNELVLFGDYISETILKDYPDNNQQVTLNLPNNNQYIAVTFLDNKLVFTDIHNHHFILQEIMNRKDKITFLPLINYEKYNDELSALNYPMLNKKYLLRVDQKVRVVSEDVDQKPIKIISFPLHVNETIIDIQMVYPFGEHGSLLVLTNLGRLFGVGENKLFELKIGDRSDDPLYTPVLLNPLLGKKTTFDDLKRLIQLHQHNKDFIHHFDELIPKELLENDEVLLFKTIANNFPTYNESLYTKEKIIKFINQLPEKRIELLHLNLEVFKDPSNIEEMSELIPEFILLFHNGYYQGSEKKDIALAIFEKYMGPIIHNPNGSVKTLKELFSATNRAFGLWHLSDNLNNLSNNFLLALYKFKVKFDFISYPYLVSKGYRGIRNDIHAEVIDKIQEECTLVGQVKITQNEQINILIERDHYVLAERLTTLNKITKSKFLSVYAKFPDKFSLKFRSILLGTKQTTNHVSKTINKDNSNRLIHYLNSDKGHNLFIFNDKYYLTGRVSHSNFPGINYYAKTPYLLNPYLQAINPGSHVALLASLNESMVVVYEDSKIFTEGALARHVRKIQGQSESDKIIEISPYLNLQNGEMISKIIMNDSWDSPIFLTSNHRVLLFITYDNYSLFEEKNDTISLSTVDLTPTKHLQNGEWIIDIASSASSYAFFLTSLGRILFKSNSVDEFMPIKTPNGNEKFLKIKAHDFGVLLFTTNNELWFSGIKINGTEIVAWHKTRHSDRGLSSPEYPPFYFEKLNFHLETSEKVSQFDIHRKHALVLTDSGRVLLWGDNENGALGTERTKLTHMLVQGFLKKGETIVDVFAGDECTYLVTSLQRIFAFGKNQSYSLGDGTSSSRYTPTDITKKFGV